MDLDFTNLMKDTKRKGIIASLIVFPPESRIPKNLISDQIHLTMVKNLMYWINDK